MNNTITPQHKIGETVAYHLLPGVAILAAYLLVTPLLRRLGLPSMMSLWLICLLVLVPLELGILYWQGKKRNGKFSLEGHRAQPRKNTGMAIRPVDVRRAGRGRTVLCPVRRAGRHSPKTLCLAAGLVLLQQRGLERVQQRHPVRQLAGDFPRHGQSSPLTWRNSTSAASCSRAWPG